MKASRSGFTLLEVLIVTLFLSVLAFTTFQEIRSTVTAKEIVDQTTEVLQESRAVVALLDRDIRSATMITADDLVWEPLPPKEGEPPVPPKPTPVTIFEGKAQSLFFSARSHQRMSADIPENEQHFVTYQLYQGDLIRGESARAVNIKDRENADKYKKFTVLKNVKNLKFSFWDEKSEKWIDRWDTQRPENQDQVPPAVKVEIEYRPDVKETARKKLKDAKIATSIRILESAFKSPPPKTPAAPAAPASPGATPNPDAGGGST